jgi:hypothetical protein
MPFPFVLSTTSYVSYQASLTSSTHPSLPSAATSHRAILRAALKAHKRLSPSDQAINFSQLISTIEKYLRYLTSLDLALSGKAVAGEDIDIALAKEPEIEWRPTLGSTAIPGRETERVKGKGLDFEIFFVHHTLALIQSLLARQALLALYSKINPGEEERKAAVQNATKYLSTAYLLHSYLIRRANSSTDGPPTFPASAIDISSTVQTSLQHLTQAEYNLLCVLKDDPYPALLAQSRNKDDREWMIRAPHIPKVRAQVLTRLCIGAAEQASTALAALSVEASKASKDLVEYCDGVKRSARAKACRFQALDEDTSGQIGKGIAWLLAAMNELGMDMPKESSKPSGLGKLKSSWLERREDKRIEKGTSNWGMDGGKMEESRIVEYLYQKFNKENDTISNQIIPEWRPLLTVLPSGMNMPLKDNWTPVVLEEEELTAMRAPPDDDGIMGGDSSNDDGVAKEPVGAFPGTQRDYGGGVSYY